MNIEMPDNIGFREMSQKAKTVLSSLCVENEEIVKRSIGVNSLALILTEKMRQLDNQAITCLHGGAILLDIGNISVPSSILLKQESLLDTEFDLVKKHSIFGYCAARMVDMPQDVADIILYHHERFDGKGYPYGLRGKAIPLLARICTVLDAFYSMISDQPYRKKLTLEGAFKQLELNRGTQFDPDVVDHFQELRPKIQTQYRY